MTAPGDFLAFAVPPLRLPVTRELLDRVTQRIVARRPDATVVLFGSRARGDARDDSDVDLLVITETDSPLETAGDIYMEIGDRDFGIDIVAMTPERFARSARASIRSFKKSSRGGACCVDHLPDQIEWIAKVDGDGHRPLPSHGPTFPPAEPPHGPV